MDSGFCQAFGRLMVYSTTQIAKSRINKFEITMFCFLSCDVTSICLHTAARSTHCAVTATDKDHC